MKLKDLFYKKMVRQELSKSRNHGCFVNIPLSKRGKPEEKGLIEILLNPFKLPSFFVKNYLSTKKLQIFWEILDEAKDKRGTTYIFKNDDWLKKNYFNEGVSWEIVSEYLTGTLFFPDIYTLLGQVDNELDGYKVVGRNLNLNTDNWHPLDFHSRYTAFLKSENKEIIDNVWLIDLDGQKVYDMEISVEKYFELAYQAKLFYGWQSVYLLKKKSEHFEFMKRFLPKIVPHMTLDLTEFGIKN